MPSTFTKLEIPDVILVEPKVFSDNRGHFFEIFKQTEFEKEGIEGPFVQDNASLSLEKGTIRGLHFQLNPRAQGKLVRVVNGRIFDVAVDIRVGSPTFGHHLSAELSSENHLQLWIPPGFAHGFQTLEPNTIIIYKNTNEYSTEHEGGIVWNDPAIAIKWPIDNPILSERDTLWPTLENASNNFVYQGGR